MKRIPEGKVAKDLFKEQQATKSDTVENFMSGIRKRWHQKWVRNKLQNQISHPSQCITGIGHSNFLNKGLEC